MPERTETMQAILTSEQGQRIFGMVSPIYGESYTFLWLFQVIGKLLDAMQVWSDQFLTEVSPCTADWSIGYWEDEYGLIPERGWTLEQRRQNVVYHMKYNLPVSPKRLSDLASTVADVPVEIVENVGKNAFRVVVHGETSNLSAVQKWIDQYKPSHLIYTLWIHIRRTFRQNLPIGFAGAVGAAYKGEPVSQDRTAITPVPVSYGGFLTSGQTGSPSDVRTEVTAHTNGVGGMFCYTHTKSKLIE